MEETIKRLKRYSEQCIAEQLDPDFAEAVIDAIVYLETIVAMEKMKAEDYYEGNEDGK